MFSKNVGLAILAASFSCQAIASTPPSDSASPPAQSGPIDAKDRSEAFTGKITRSHVRLRLKPDVESPVIKELAKDEYLLIDGEDQHFYRVVPPSEIQAYVFRSFVLDNVVEGNRVNVRLHPSVDAPIIGQLNAGDKINGRICQQSPKWLEISLPESARFYVAKEYVAKAGDSSYLASLQNRRTEVKQMLSFACHLSQKQLKGPFDEINAEEIKKTYEKICQEYGEFEGEVKQAQSMLALFEDAYLHKKLDFLESRAEETSLAFDAKQAAFEAEVNAYQQRLNEIDRLWCADRPLENTSTITEISWEEQQVSQEAFLPEHMRKWQAVEESFYTTARAEQEFSSMEEFYHEQELQGIELHGYIEPFTRHVKNCPGDYLLRCGNTPVAYLYSTKIDLSQMVGRNVKLLACPRPNHHFAFPAYFVLAAE